MTSYLLQHILPSVLFGWSMGRVAGLLIFYRPIDLDLGHRIEIAVYCAYLLAYALIN